MSANIPYIHIPLSDFPSDILKWMKANAAPKMSLKLMKVCKYFKHFSEFPFFVVKEAIYGTEALECYVTTLDNEIHLMEDEDIINLTKKIWVTDKFGIFDSSVIFSTITQKYAVLDIKNLVLYHQRLSYNELKLLTASGIVEKLEFFDTIFYFEDGAQVFMDSIFKCVPNIETFNYFNSEKPVFVLTSINPFQEINTLKIKNIGIDICGYPYFQMFLKFMEKNPQIKYQINFFGENLLSNTEIKSVEQYVQRIIDSGLTEFPPPSINFDQQSAEQRKSLISLIRKYNKKIKK